MAASPAAGRSARPQATNERITVALIPGAAAHLRRLQQRTNLSETDPANRAITSHEFLNAQFQAGHELIIGDGRTGKRPSWCDCRNAPPGRGLGRRAEDGAGPPPGWRRASRHRQEFPLADRKARK